MASIPDINSQKFDRLIDGDTDLAQYEKLKDELKDDEQAASERTNGYGEDNAIEPDVQ